MATSGDLQSWRDRLQEARFGGLREVRDSSGESVAYKSDSEMARALAALDREIAAHSAPRASIVYPQTSKGT